MIPIMGFIVADAILGFGVGITSWAKETVGVGRMIYGEKCTGVDRGFVDSSARCSEPLDRWTNFKRGFHNRDMSAPIRYYKAISHAGQRNKL